MSKIKIICPNPAMIPAPVMGNIPREEMYENLWMVNRQAYDNCTINSSNQNRLLMKCDTPLHLRYFTIVFQRFSAVGPSGLEFEPGKEFYFIGKITIHSCISTYYHCFCFFSWNCVLYILKRNLSLVVCVCFCFCRFFLYFVFFL